MGEVGTQQPRPHSEDPRLARWSRAQASNRVIHVVQFSGGKDSTAVLLLMRERGVNHRTVFADTGWEHPLTYEYIRELDEKLGLGVEWIKSEKYPGGFAQLCVERKIVPGIHSRFCTDELKIKPLHAWIEKLDDECTTYQGIRAEESFARSRMPARQWVDEATGYWIERPILSWTAEDVFAIHKRHGVKPNKLYLYGMRRVGCAPCIFVNKGELRQWALRFPEIREKVEALEAAIPQQPASFFRADYIPPRFSRTNVTTTKDGRTMPVPTAAEVFDYVTELDRRQLSLLGDETPKCVSVYNLCE